MMPVKPTLAQRTEAAKLAALRESTLMLMYKLSARTWAQLAEARRGR